MGKVSQYYMEEIEANEGFGAHCAQEPEADYEGELIERTSHLFDKAKSLYYHRDGVIQQNIMSLLISDLELTLFLARKHHQRLSEENEAALEEEEAAHHAYEAIKDVVSEVRSTFI